MIFKKVAEFQSTQKMNTYNFICSNSYTPNLYMLMTKVDQKHLTTEIIQGLELISENISRGLHKSILTLQKIFWTPSSFLNGVSNSWETGFLKVIVWIYPVSTPNISLDGLLGFWKIKAKSNEICYVTWIVKMWCVIVLILANTV